MNPKSSRSTNPKMAQINLLKPHRRCYKWLSPSDATTMHIKSHRIAHLIIAAFWLAAIAVPADARDYYVSETKGTVEIRGWEKGIIKKNPNLKHWHWMPITANYNHMKPVAPSKKPWKVERVLRKAPVDRRFQKPRYVRMNHATLPTAHNSDGSMRRNPNVSNPLVTHDVDGSMRARDVAAKLRMQRTQPQLATRDVNAGLYMPVVRGQYKLAKHEVAGYLANKKTDVKLASHDLSGQLGSRAVAGKLASKNLDGRLISQNVSAALASRTVSAEMVTPIERRYEFSYRGPNEGFDDTPTFSTGMLSTSGKVTAKIKRYRQNKY